MEDANEDLLIEKIKIYELKLFPVDKYLTLFGVMVALIGFNFIKGTDSTASIIPGIDYCGIYYWLVTAA